MNCRLKKLRKDELKLTQDQFAKSLGISRSHVTNLEVGKMELTERMMKTICSVHNVNEDWLMNGNEPIFSNQSEELDMLIANLYAENDEFKKEVIKTMLTFDDDDWKFMKKFITTMKKTKV